MIRCAPYFMCMQLLSLLNSMLSEQKIWNYSVYFDVIAEFYTLFYISNHLTYFCFHSDSGFHIYFFSCDLAAPGMVRSIRLSICPSVRLPVPPSVTSFLLCSHHLIIMKWHKWCPYKRTRSELCLSRSSIRFQVARDTKLPIVTQIECFWTVTLVWIH